MERSKVKILKKILRKREKNSLYFIKKKKGVAYLDARRIRN